LHRFCAPIADSRFFLYVCTCCVVRWWVRRSIDRDWWHSSVWPARRITVRSDRWWYQAVTLLSKVFTVVGCLGATKRSTMTVQKLWIGGTSGLARTYMNTFGFHDGWIFLGQEQTTPEWMPPDATYYSCNFADTKPASTSLLVYLEHVEQIVISIRPPLFSPLTNGEMDAYCEQLMKGLQRFLHALLARTNNVQSILHISSVAAANHLQAQHFLGFVAPGDKMISSSDLQAPYDRFKRACEELVESLGTVSTTNLRISAIFSDDPGCIQCQALQIQSRVGSYLTQCIDCNSSRNVAIAIRLILASQQEKKQLSTYYYYTRPARQYPHPVPYGEYLVEYRRAHELRWYVWVPTWVVRCFVDAIHWLAMSIQPRLAFLESVDYLLQVSYRDHSFDNVTFLADFPEILGEEETIEHCFRRRQRLFSIHTWDHLLLMLWMKDIFNWARQGRGWSDEITVATDCCYFGQAETPRERESSVCCCRTTYSRQVMPLHQGRMQMQEGGGGARLLG